MQVGGEDAGVFVDGAVLHHYIVGTRDFHHIPEALVEEINLEIERPTRYVVVVVFEIRVEVYVLKAGYPSIMLCKHCGKGGLSASDISGYCNMHIVQV